MVLPLHVHAVEVNRRGLISKVVVDVNNDPVSNGGLDARRRPLTVDDDDGSRYAIRGDRLPADAPVVVNIPGSCEWSERKQPDRGFHDEEQSEDQYQALELPTSLTGHDESGSTALWSISFL